MNIVTSIDQRIFSSLLRNVGFIDDSGIMYGKMSFRKSVFIQIYFGIIFIVFLAGCSSPKGNNEEINHDNVYKIDVETSIDQKKKVLLSEVAAEINYIPLETSPDNLINEVSQIKITESYIFVSDYDKLLQFTRDGKFVRQIGRKGRGPGEYSGIMKFDVNEQADIVLILGFYGLNEYDTKGNFKRKISKKDSFIRFLIYSPSRIAYYRFNDIEQPINLVITDLEFNQLFLFYNQNPRIRSNTKYGNTPMYVFENKLCFKEQYNDTLFFVNDSLLIPHIIYKERKLLVDKDFNPRSDLPGLINEIEKMKDKLREFSIYESRRYVFTSYLRGIGPSIKDQIRVLFDKKNNKTSVLDDDGFENDMSGGRKLWPLEINDDNIMVNYEEAYKLKALVASDAFKNATPKYPEKKKALENLANNLTENDNLVLILVKLKE